MAAQSFSMPHGAGGLKSSDFTAATNAPAAGDFELRWNTTDTNGANIRREDIVFFLERAREILLTGGATVNLLTLAGAATPTPPLV